MKRKLLLGSLAGLVLLGGAIGVGASFSDDNSKTSQSSMVVRTDNSNVSQVHPRNDDDNNDDNSNVSQGQPRYDDNSNVGQGQLRNDDNNSTVSQVQTRKGEISRDEAIGIAVKGTPGRIEEIEKDDGHFEITIKDGRNEVEYKIDSKTGTILEKDVDKDDD